MLAHKRRCAAPDVVMPRFKRRMLPPMSVPEHFAEILRGLVHGSIELESREHRQLQCFYALLCGLMDIDAETEWADKRVHPIDWFVNELGRFEMSEAELLGMAKVELEPRHMYLIGHYASLQCIKEGMGGTELSSAPCTVQAPCVDCLDWEPDDDIDDADSLVETVCTQTRLLPLHWLLRIGARTPHALVINNRPSSYWFNSEVVLSHDEVDQMVRSDPVLQTLVQSEENPLAETFWASLGVDRARLTSALRRFDLTQADVHNSEVVFALREWLDDAIESLLEATQEDYDAVKTILTL